jgi:hypothetical protein
MEDVNKKVATLESLVDYLKTELTNLNTLLLDCGFTEGIETLKTSAAEFLKGL